MTAVRIEPQPIERVTSL